MKSIGPLPPPTTVSHLLDPATHDWNEHLVESLFDVPDCDAILSIPTSCVPFDDEIVWHFTKSRKFSVKSAYHLAFDSNWQHLPSSSCSTSDLIRDGWRGIWNAKVPNKIHVFCWRLCTDSLPLGHKLSRRVPDTPEARPARIPTLPYPHHSLGSRHISPIWTAPPSGFIKLNSDAAIFQSVGDFGVGVIARDSGGHCLAWSALRLHHSLSPEVAEAWAARIAIQLAHRFGWTNIILEGDCASVHSHLSSPGACSSAISPIVFDIISLSTSFNSCVFSLVRRTGNTVAHSLARHAVNRDEGTDLLPSYACVLALADLPS
ncbi:UNVERIFIED_CONTAM: hypothetical protein Slati_2441900 [Sesamum latifolium]|uniref:RNase H type-1 domain-containing protein n=1 Tax=Sesamum latifolium TaxID=2727402 RepID=A0AAW2WE26_9LAMI